MFQFSLGLSVYCRSIGKLGGVVDAPKELVFFTDGPVQSMIGGQVRNMSLGPD